MRKFVLFFSIVICNITTYSQKIEIMEMNEYLQYELRDTIHPQKDYKSIKSKRLKNYQEAIAVADKYIDLALSVKHLKVKFSKEDEVRICLVGNYYCVNRVVIALKRIAIGTSVIIDRRNAKLILFREIGGD